MNFSASWCGPCKRMAPQFAALSDAYDHINFVKIDVDNSPNLATEERVTVCCDFCRFWIECSYLQAVQEQQMHFTSNRDVFDVMISLLARTWPNWKWWLIKQKALKQCDSYCSFCYTNNRGIPTKPPVLNLPSQIALETTGSRGYRPFLVILKQRAVLVKPGCTIREG